MSIRLSPSCRVIVDNDFAGDPDDLFALAHQLLCPSVEVPFVIGSHLRGGDPFSDTDHQAADAVTRAQELIELMGMAERVPVLLGSEVALHSATEPIRSAATDAIIAEALREDTDLPLFITCGGGLTELASALMLEPRIASKLTTIWIGGPEHPGVAPLPPGGSELEYNLAIDPWSAMSVFGDSEVELWQVPRNTYRQCLISLAELEGRVLPHGELGAYLYDAIASVIAKVSALGLKHGETYALGDSPLVLLSSLRSAFEPDPSSSCYASVPTPRLTKDGQYVPNPAGRPMRRYDRVDTRLMFEDMFVKLAAFAGRG